MNTTQATIDRLMLIEALREAHAALAMMIAPDAIEQTTVMSAYAAAVAAEAKARAALDAAETEAA
jgi:hypothetical protein